MSASAENTHFTLLQITGQFPYSGLHDPHIPRHQAHYSCFLFY
jgi:hypothetical protein